MECRESRSSELRTERIQPGSVCTKAYGLTGSRGRPGSRLMPQRAEVNVLITPHAIEQLSGRIEQAYLRRRSQALVSEPDSRLWEVAARALVEAHRKYPWLPVDPELFVAAQPPCSPLGDPWQHLAPAHAIRRYRQRVVLIVRGLRRELFGEIRRLESRIRAGHSLDSVLGWRTRRVSDLARYLVAHRAGRPDLAEPFRAGTQDQHEGCPLYRLACRGLIDPDLYPVLDLLPGLVLRRRVGPPVGLLTLN